MKRTLKEILQFLMQIESDFSGLYRSMADSESPYTERFKTIAKVLAAEESSHYEWFRDLIADAGLAGIELKESTYEMASSNLASFQASISPHKDPGKAEVVKMAYEYELKNAETLWTIYGNLKEETGEENTPLLKFIEDLIQIEEKHAENLKPFIRKGRQ